MNDCISKLWIIAAPCKPLNVVEECTDPHCKVLFWRLEIKDHTYLFRSLLRLLEWAAQGHYGRQTSKGNKKKYLKKRYRIDTSSNETFESWENVDEVNFFINFKKLKKTDFLSQWAMVLSEWHECSKTNRKEVNNIFSNQFDYYNCKFSGIFLAQQWRKIRKETVRKRLLTQLRLNQAPNLSVP